MSTIYSIGLSCGPFSSAPEKQTEFSVVIRSLSAALGAIAAIAGLVLAIQMMPGLGGGVGWTLFAAGDLFIVAGIGLRCFKKERPAPAPLPSPPPAPLFEKFPELFLELRIAVARQLSGRDLLSFCETSTVHKEAVEQYLPKQLLQAQLRQGAFLKWKKEALEPSIFPLFILDGNPIENCAHDCAFSPFSKEIIEALASEYLSEVIEVLKTLLNRASRKKGACSCDPDYSCLYLSTVTRALAGLVFKHPLQVLPLITQAMGILPPTSEARSWHLYHCADVLSVIDPEKALEVAKKIDGIYPRDAILRAFVQHKTPLFRNMKAEFLATTVSILVDMDHPQLLTLFAQALERSLATPLAPHSWILLRALARSLKEKPLKIALPILEQAVALTKRAGIDHPILRVAELFAQSPSHQQEAAKICEALLSFLEEAEPQIEEFFPEGTHLNRLAIIKCMASIDPSRAQQIAEQMASDGEKADAYLALAEGIEPAKAEKWLDQALIYHTHEPKRLIAIAQHYAKIGKKQRALELLQSDQLDRSSPEVLKALFEVDFETGGERLKQIKLGGRPNRQAWLLLQFASLLKEPL